MLGFGGMNPETVNGFALAASKGGKVIVNPKGLTEAGLLTADN